ncbi:hypothetical protein TRVL_07920 [Trypanosoma vivax]|nr:hypothetical protein TRVL_07920 [Trypanosoma vivax]
MRKWRTASSHPSTRSTSGLRRHSTCTASLTAPKSHTTRRFCSGPGAFTSTSPRRVASRRTHQKRTRRCTPCGECSGSVTLTIRCGRTGQWCWMSRQELERWCARRTVGVRRWCWELGRLPASIARSA